MDYVARFTIFCHEAGQLKIGEAVHHARLFSFLSYISIFYYVTNTRDNLVQEEYTRSIALTGGMHMSWYWVLLVIVLGLTALIYCATSKRGQEWIDDVFFASSLHEEE